MQRFNKTLKISKQQKDLKRAAYFLRDESKSCKNLAGKLQVYCIFLQ